MTKQKIGKIELPRGTQLERIIESFKLLKLDAISSSYEDIAEQISKKHGTMHDLVEQLMELQLMHNEESRVSRWIQQAKLMPLTTINDYDFSLQPSVDPVQMHELLSCRFINQGKNIILLGPPGVGKTHLAVALGYEAIVQGYETRLMRLNEFIDTIHKTADDALVRLFRSLTTTKLLILDDIDYYTTDESSGEFLFDVIKQRHLSKMSTILTSNKNPKDWGNVFGLDRTGAALDRIFDRLQAVTINIMGGQSYRVPISLSASPNLSNQAVDKPKSNIKRVVRALTKQ